MRREKCKCERDFLRYKMVICRLMTHRLIDWWHVDWWHVVDVYQLTEQTELLRKSKHVITDRLRTIEQLSEICGISSSSVQRNITDDLPLTIKKNVETFHALKEQFKTDLDIGNDTEIKQQSIQWKTSLFLRPKKSNMQRMLTGFFDESRTVHSEFVPSDQTVNHVLYMKVLRWLYSSNKTRFVADRELIFSTWPRICTCSYLR